MRDREKGLGMGCKRKAREKVGLGEYARGGGVSRDIPRGSQGTSMKSQGWGGLEKKRTKPAKKAPRE